ncbi:MAG: TetR/AcrR family transcriptional regulator [Bacteroidota bacterium]
MSRKEDIKVAAIRMFNELGLNQVSLKTIAREMGISDGNLRYHYKTKEDLILAIFYDMCGGLDQLVLKQKIEDLGIDMILKGQKESFDIFYEFRFLMLNLSTIVRNPELKRIQEYLQETLTQRKKAYHVIFLYMVGKGNLIAEPEEGRYEKIIDQMFLVGDFWLSDAAIYHPNDLQGQIKHYLELLLLPLVPYFTDEGRRIYDEAWAELWQEEVS